MTGTGEKPKRRLFRLLRRGTRESTVAGSLNAVEESALWTSHQRAEKAVRETGEGAQRMASHVAKQRSIVDSLVERSRGASARATDLSTSFARLQDGFARLELVALNAGLEGARLGEGPGHALGLVSEEVRAQSTRGSEACRELALGLGEIGSELAQVQTNLDRAREAAADVALEAGKVGGAASDAERALVDMGDRLKTATGSDPEIAGAIYEATEHARALVASLATATAKAPSSIVLAALRPVLEPLLKLLEGEDGAR